MKSRLFAGVLLALFAAGCTTQQLAQVQTDIQKLQTAYSATTQAVDLAQQDLDAVKQQLAVASTQPGTDPKTLSALQAAATKAQGVLNGLVAHEQQLQAGIAQAQNIVTAIQTGTAPNVSPLSVFGPYGSLAAILITAGWGVYQQVKNSKNVGLIDTLVSATGANTPAAAVAQAHAAIASAPDPAATASPAAPKPA